jgi:transposase
MQQQVTTVGLDLAKNLFQVHGADAQGRPVLKKRVARERVREFFANLPPCLVGLEACAAAHHWARELAKHGHTVRLMPPQYVRPYVKTNKHDAADAEACCEAVQRPGMRFVPIKNEGQQALLMLHRVREQLLKQRTATINALRAHLAEFGIVAAQRQAGLRELLAVVADPEDRRMPPLARELLAVVADPEDRRMPPLARELLQVLADHLRSLQERTAELDRRLVAAARDGAACERLAGVPGIGPVIATALVAAVGDAKAFGSGRHLAAWLGLVPRQHSSGGKERLLGISKRGDAYLRRQLMHGARALVAVAKGREGGLWSWVNGLLGRRPFNVVVAAVANKLARVAWALLSRGEDYRAAAA